MLKVGAVFAAVGAVIFVGVVAFVFLFVSGAVTPFTGNPQDSTVTANRVADELASDQLGSPADPYVLDTFCTRAFFDSLNGGSVPARCAYENDSLNDRVGVPDLDLDRVVDGLLGPEGVLPVVEHGNLLHPPHPPLGRLDPSL
jgi:hypothetical protein